MDEHDADTRIGELVSALLHLSRNLDPQDLQDLLGAIGVEIDTALEIVLERSHARRPAGTVVAFPKPPTRRDP